MNKVIAATLFAATALATTAAVAENPGQFQQERIAAILAADNESTAKAVSNGPFSAVISFGSDAVKTLNNGSKGTPHAGKDRYGPPRGVHGGPDR